MAQPGSVLKILRQLSANGTTATSVAPTVNNDTDSSSSSSPSDTVDGNNTATEIEIRTWSPSVGTIQHRQQERMVEGWKYLFQRRSCLSFRRKLFTPAGSSYEELAKDVPTALLQPNDNDDVAFPKGEVTGNASSSIALNLDTIRYRYRQDLNAGNGNPKSLIDLSAVSLDEIESHEVLSQMGPHFPFFRVCPRGPDSTFKTPYQGVLLPLVVHHYLGTWEEYSCRDDARGLNDNTTPHSRASWFNHANHKEGGATDEIRPWLQGFVNMVGVDEAKRLLEGAGDLSACGQQQQLEGQKSTPPLPYTQSAADNSSAMSVKATPPPPSSDPLTTAASTGATAIMEVSTSDLRRTTIFGSFAKELRTIRNFAKFYNNSSCPTDLNGDDDNGDNIQATLVTQTSLDRLWIMRETCRRWQSNPIVVVVGMKQNESSSELTSELEKWDRDLPCRQNLDIIEYRLDEDQSKPANDPLNTLRNVGLDAVTTSHVLLLDVDFVPSDRLDAKIVDVLKERRKLRRLLNGNSTTQNLMPAEEKEALVIPIFERFPPCTDASTRDVCFDGLKRNSTFIPQTFEGLRKCIFVQDDCAIVSKYGGSQYFQSSTRTENWLEREWYDEFDSTVANKGLRNIRSIKYVRVSCGVSISLSSSIICSLARVS